MRAPNLELALRVTDNAKTQKYSPCNAAESLLVHAAIAPAFLPRIGALFAAKGVEMRVDAASRALLQRRAEGEARRPRPNRTGPRNTWRRSSA